MVDAHKLINQLTDVGIKLRNLLAFKQTLKLTNDLSTIRFDGFLIVLFTLPCNTVSSSFVYFSL